MRGLDDFYFVDEQPLLTPDAGVELRFQDLDAASAGRDEGGFMHRMVVRRRVRSWRFSYAVLTEAELSYLRSLLCAPTFTFRFGEAQTIAYCSGEEAQLQDRTRGIYRGLHFDIIEC